ncbi:MAG: hypothetical protein M9954_16535 [Cyclobacteriaceae bacterium]|nr:hypothetical protein [Kiritimatiellia bacterium]MCO5068184.1 hypothetical protein [Kiritimatiellia bacterium]MCO5273270.1 hypothetical protein [Cyclobacteriaceae bacterium]
MKKYRCCFIIFSLLFISACQGRLHLVLHNDSGVQITVLADEKKTLLPVNGVVTIKCPSNRILFLGREETLYKFILPLSPRPHSINAYINSGTLIAAVRVESVSSIYILPENDSETNAPISIIGSQQ